MKWLLFWVQRRLNSVVIRTYCATKQGKKYWRKNVACIYKISSVLLC
jgi:hypothetical protein